MHTLCSIVDPFVLTLSFVSMRANEGRIVPKTFGFGHQAEPCLGSSPNPLRIFNSKNWEFAWTCIRGPPDAENGGFPELPNSS